jgi:hypothetical protein
LVEELRKALFEGRSDEVLAILLAASADERATLRRDTLRLVLEGAGAWRRLLENRPRPSDFTFLAPSIDAIRNRLGQKDALTAYLLTCAALAPRSELAPLFSESVHSNLLDWQAPVERHLLYRPDWCCALETMPGGTMCCFACSIMMARSAIQVGRCWPLVDVSWKRGPYPQPTFCRLWAARHVVRGSIGSSGTRRGGESPGRL